MKEPEPMVELDDPTILAKTALPGSAPEKWIRRWYIALFCFLPAGLMLGIFVATGATSELLLGHVLLGLGTWSALRLLADRPLLNPVQSIVFLFHFWFGIGASGCAAFYCWTGNAEKFDVYYRGDFGTLAIVAAGLPVYGFVGAFVLQHWPSRFHAAFLLPHSVSYSPRSIAAFALVGGAVYALMFFLRQMGIQAFENVNYLGGSVSTSPVLAAVASLTQLANGFGLYGFLHAWYAEPEKIRRYRAVGVLALVLLAGLNLFSGSKGMVVFIALVPLILCFSLRQRIPAFSLALLAAGYLLVLQPFVDNARMISEAEKITTPEQRQDLFKQYIGSRGWSLDRISSLNLESPFRYMYAAASRVTPLSSELSGPWEGQSLKDGLSAATPRFIDKEKADSNMGNFFARELGLAHPHNYMHNVTITIPFEIVGNYGWIAGVLSFGLMALVFAAGSAWLLSKGRLATHPLTPMAILMLTKVEASCGQFVNAHKTFPIVLGVAWLIWLALGRKL